jgi:transcriptional regulator with XRE-family HTH domain
MATFSERLKQALELRGVKPSVLSYKTNISEASISHYIAGHYTPKGKRIQIIADALHVSSAWLNGFDVPRDGLTAPSEPQLNDGEEKLLELFRSVPEEDRPMVLGMIEVALSNKR